MTDQISRVEEIVVKRFLKIFCDPSFLLLLVGDGETTLEDNAAKAKAYKDLLLDIAEGTWGFPPLFEQWRKDKPIR